MSFPSLQLTDAGRQIIVKAISGQCAIVFTKFGVGNGDAPADVNALTDLVNLVKNISINDDPVVGDGCANLTGTLDNADLSAGIWWTEVGIYATDPDDGEVLYAYAHAGEYAEYIPAYSNQSYLRTTLNVTVIVGDAENVEAVIGEYAGYVTREDFEAHAEATNNPHSVTKEQIGLGNVPNVSTNNQTPTFAEASTLATIVSGETASTIFGKIKKAITSLISHINASNPHGITCSKIGAATSGHTHSASQITGGVLPITRGGTGVQSIASLRNLLNLNIQTLYATGTYTGTGAYGSASPNSLKFAHAPKFLIVMPETGTDARYEGFMALAGVTNLYTGGIANDVANTRSQIRFTWDGTTVSWYNTTSAADQQNTNGATYRYFALY
jgi:hypothetical protein